MRIEDRASRRSSGATGQPTSGSDAAGQRESIKRSRHASCAQMKQPSSVSSTSMEPLELLESLESRAEYQLFRAGFQFFRDE